MATTGYWQVVTLTESGDLAGIERAVGELALAHSVFRHDDGKRWRVEAICDHAPEEWPLSGETTVQPLEMRDWVAESQAALPALDIGRFHVRGGWDRRGHAGQIDLVIEAGQAFGTGRHESTEGCLVVLQQVARQRRVFSVLDVGTGAGILAIAAARLTGARAVGTDIDPVSIDVAIENADLNRAGTRCRFTTADGTRHGLIASGRPYDLVFANILAKPLAAMSGIIAREVAPGGDLILAGILNHQVPLVLSRYRPLGLRLVHHRRRNGWSILRLSRPGV